MTYIQDSTDLINRSQTLKVKTFKQNTRIRITGFKLFGLTSLDDDYSHTVCGCLY